MQTTIVSLINMKTSQALLNSPAYLHVDDTSIFNQHKHVTEIKIVLNKEFSNACDWFVDNKLSIHFGEVSEKNLTELNITYNDNTVKS